MRFMFTLITAVALCAPPLVAQDTTAIKAVLQRVDMDVDTIRRDKSRPSYVKRADARIDSVYVPAILAAMRRQPSAPVVASVTIQSLGTTLKVDSTLQLYAVPKDALGNAINSTVVWGTASPAVADISATGILTGKSAGTVAITAKAGGVAAARTYTVTASTPPPIPPDTTTPPPIPVDTSKFDGIAELPRSVPKPVDPTCLRTTRLAAGSNFQNAINAATPGDCLNLAPDATFVGNFYLPNKGTSSNWVTIRTENANVAPGTRVTPSMAAALRFAKIQANGYNEALRADPGAHHYRFSNVEIGTTPAAQQTGMNELIEAIGGTQHDFQFDHVYAHGTPTLDIRRLLRADIKNLVVVDGWWAEGHSNNSDSQCWIPIVGGQQQLYENNYCSAGHELWMTGGGDPPDSTLSPRDVILRRNHFERPIAWKGVWQAKNLIETKNIRRMLIEGNVMENSWPDAQAGFCFVLKSENQDGTAPWTTTSDITIRYNIVRRCASGFNLSGKGSSSAPNITSARYSIHDNQLDSLAKYGGDGIGLQLLSDITDVQFVHNTVKNGYPGGSNSAVIMDGAPAAIRLTMHANLMGRGAFGVKGGGTGEGKQSLDQYAKPYTFTNNSLVANWAYTAPPCSAYPATTSCISAFPSANLTVGADSAKVALWTKGVVVYDAPPLMPLTLMRAATPVIPLKYKIPVVDPACQKPDAKCPDLPMRLR